MFPEPTSWPHGTLLVGKCGIDIVLALRPVRRNSLGRKALMKMSMPSLPAVRSRFAGIRASSLMVAAGKKKTGKTNFGSVLQLRWRTGQRGRKNAGRAFCGDAILWGWLTGRNAATGGSPRNGECAPRRPGVSRLGRMGYGGDRQRGAGATVSLRRSASQVRGKRLFIGCPTKNPPGRAGGRGGSFRRCGSLACEPVCGPPPLAVYV